MSKNKLKCRKCKEYLDRENFGLASFKKRNNGKWDNRVGICKECDKEKNRLYHSTDKGRYSTYKRNSKKRKLEFDLLFDDFCELIHGKCSYCGKDDCNGIDRKDNSKGYIIDNTISCCWECNKFKSSRNYEEFINIITNIYKYIN